MNEVEKVWEDFWRDIVCNKDGTLNLEQIKKELYDFSIALEEVPKVYDALTGGKISKINTLHDVVISVAEDYFSELSEES